MNEKELAERVCSALNHSTRQLDRDTLARLAGARNAALAQHRATRAEGALAGLGVAGAGVSFRSRPARRWAAVAVLLVAATLVVYWQGREPAADVADIDAALLAGDLPLHAYTDPRFPAWVRRNEQ
ncbi:MAG: DUF3619 family protein [Pseudomonadota bacterium]